MMLTVMKNTKSPVKFWFLKNYLSPTLQVHKNYNVIVDMIYLCRTSFSCRSYMLRNIYFFVYTTVNITTFGRLGSYFRNSCVMSVDKHWKNSNKKSFSLRPRNFYWSLVFVPIGKNSWLLVYFITY